MKKVIAAAAVAVALAAQPAPAHAFLAEVIGLIWDVYDVNNRDTSGPVKQTALEELEMKSTPPAQPVQTEGEEFIPAPSLTTTPTLTYKAGGAAAAKLANPEIR